MNYAFRYGADQMGDMLRQRDATIDQLMAEVAALKARPAMPWRRREDGEELKCGFYLAVLELGTGTKISYARVVSGWPGVGARVLDCGFAWGMEKVTHYIPWSDLMPPDGKDAS